MTQYLLRILIAGILGFVIGFARTSESNQLSNRMFSIICMSSALVTITSIGIYETLNLPWIADPGRLPAQVISALGFLGTGLIWVTEDRKVLGITSAASLWLTAILGMMVGMGLNQLSIIGVLFIMLIYWSSHLVAKYKPKRLKN